MPSFLFLYFSCQTFPVSPSAPEPGWFSELRTDKVRLTPKDKKEGVKNYLTYSFNKLLKISLSLRYRAPDLVFGQSRILIPDIISDPGYPARPDIRHILRYWPTILYRSTFVARCFGSGFGRSTLIYSVTIFRSGSELPKRKKYDNSSLYNIGHTVSHYTFFKIIYVLLRIL